MPTLQIECVHIQDGIRLRCPQHPAWRGPKKDRHDRQAVEAHLKAHQSRHTRFEWFEVPAPADLEHLGFGS